MRAFLVHDYGAPSALKLEETPDPSPEAGEVILDVEAAGLGYVDALLVAGRYQVKTPLPFIPGSEVAGHAAGSTASGEVAAETVDCGGAVFVYCRMSLLSGCLFHSKLIF